MDNDEFIASRNAALAELLALFAEDRLRPSAQVFVEFMSLAYVRGMRDLMRHAKEANRLAAIREYTDVEALS